MALDTASILSSKKNAESYLSANTVARIRYEREQEAKAAAAKAAATAEADKDRGGLFGGLGYVGEKFAVGLVSSLEGIVDYTASGVAKLFGADDWAEDVIANDWFGDWYSHPEEWYNPSKGWQVAGDVAGGIGTSIPGTLAAVGAGALTLATGGTAAPLLAPIAGAGASFLVSGLGAAGQATKEAYKQTGQLTGKEFGYGALTGVTEGGIEGVSNLIGMGSGAVVKGFTKAIGRETAEAFAKQGITKLLAKSFAGEAFEEAASEWLDPYWKRATYDKNAENASLDEILYAGFVGGLSGMVMGGGGYSVNKAVSLAKGNKLSKTGEQAKVIDSAGDIARFEEKNDTGVELFRDIAATRAKLIESLTLTGGKVQTVQQKTMLGDLARKNVAVAGNMFVAKRAQNIIDNAPLIAERLTAFGYKRADGTPITYTAEQLTAGFDPKKPLSIYKALKNNEALRSLAIADATGQIMMDTAKFAEATLTGQRLASQVDLNRFLGIANPEEIAAVSKALKIDDWNGLTAEAFDQKITDFINDGGVQKTLQEKERKSSFKAIPAESARPIPKLINIGVDGARRYSDGKLDIAVERKGDSYSIYDYSGDTLSRSLTRSEVNGFLREYAKKNAESRMQNAELTEGTIPQSPTAPAPFAQGSLELEGIKKFQREVREVDSFARKNIKEYRTLNAPSQDMVNKVIREGRAKGLSDSDVLMYAKVSAHSGIDIQFDKEANYRGVKDDGSADYADGFYEAAKNRIVVNPEGKRTAERLIIHELDHAIRKDYSKRDVEGAVPYVTRIYLDAIEGVDQATRDRITEAYKKTAKPGESVAAIMDETNAYYAEQVLGNKYTLEKLIEAEPTLKEKILNFFKGASSDYTDVPKLSGAAKKYYRTYKKLFDEFSARNAQSNALEPNSNVFGSYNNVAGVSDNVRTTDDNKSENAHLSTLFEKNSQKTPLTNINQGDMSVSDRQYAIKKDVHGKKYVEVDSEIVNETDSIDAIGEVLSNVVEKRFNEFIKADGQQIGINQKTRREWIRSKSAQTLLQDNKQTFLDKMNAFGNADELLQAARNYIGEKSKHTRKDNFVEFARGVVTFSVKGRGYEADVIVGTTKSGAAVLYDLVDIQNKKIEADTSYTTQDRRSDVPASVISISQPEAKSNTSTKKSSKQYAFDLGDSNKKAQFDIIQKTNPMEDEYHVGIRSADDIRTWEEVLKLDDEREGQFAWGDFSRADAEQALKNGKVTVYSSYPIKNGVFVSTSYIQAEEYSGGGGGKVYSKTVPLDKIAWINGDEGQYADVTTSSGKQYALDIDREGEVGEDGSISGAEVMSWLNKKPEGEETVLPDLPMADKKHDNILVSDRVLENEGDEFASPTISTVGKDRVTYKEKFGSKEWRKTKTESAYIHAVDEMYGIQSYLEKVGMVKNAKAVIQNVRSTPHQAQTMIGSLQYNVFESDSKSAKKMGEGLNEIFRPIEKMGERAAKDFDDYLLNYLNVDKYQVIERTQKHDKDAAESLSKVREEISNLEDERSRLENRIFNLGNSPAEVRIKEGLKESIEKLNDQIIKSRSDEIALLAEAPGYAEAELKKVRNETAELLGEKERAKTEIYTLGNDESQMRRKAELKERISNIDNKVKRLEESAAAMEEIAKAYKIATKPVFNIDGKTISKEESQRLIREYEKKYPEFKENAQKVWNFNKNLNAMRVSAGLISKRIAGRLAIMYPHYVPSFKAKINNNAQTEGGVSVTSTVKKAKGYNSNIMSVKESMASQVSQVIRNGNINMLANKVYDTAVKTGDSKYVDIKLPDAEGEDISTEGIERPKPHTLTFFKDGKEYKIDISEEIYQGFKGIGEQSAPDANVFARVTNWISDKYKRLVTSYSPAFMIRNAIRDMQDAGLNSKHPLLFARNISRAWVELVKNSENWQTYRAYGGFSSTVFDSKGVSGAVGARGFEILGINNRIESGDKLSVKDAKYLKSILTGVENLNAVVEQIPRFAEYLASIEAGETIEQAIYNSAEVTTNFGRRGATTKQLNATIIPFLNPAVQGFDKIFRNVTDAAKAGDAKAVTKAFGTLLGKAILIGILPMLFNSLMYDDDEEYKDLREEDKENNYLIKLPNGTFLKLPRGRVASVIGGLYNRTAKMAKGEDADWLGYLENVKSQVTPVENLTRTVFSPFMDVAMNRTWYGTEIEGQQFENVRPRDRYDESTSAIAIAIGQAINYSPKKIHYLIDQYSGVIGDFLLPATTKKAEKDFFSGNFTLDPVASNKLSTEFYKIYDEAQYSKTDGSVKAQYQIKYLNKAKSAISEMYNEINAIQNSDLSDYQKLQQTRALRIMINEAMKNAVRDFEEIEKAIDATQNMGFDDSKMGDVNIRYAEIIRKVYGSERALHEYNSTVYSNMSVLNTAGLSYDTLYDYYFGTKNIESDKDRLGNTIEGSKRKKVVAAINGLGVSLDERLLLICASGYSLKDNDVRGASAETLKKRLLKYILTMKLSASEKAEIAEMCGFETKNGRIVYNFKKNVKKLVLK